MMVLQKQKQKTKNKNKDISLLVVTLTRHVIANRVCHRYTNKETTRRVREAVQKGEALDVELLNYRKDGSPFWNRYILTLHLACHTCH